MSNPLEFREAPDDRDELLGRLRAAEQVCVLYGWTPSQEDSRSTKACTQAWMDWHSRYGIGSPTPAWRSRVKELAAERDRVRTATLAGLVDGAPRARVVVCAHCHDDPPRGHTCPACGVTTGA
ncbi:MAG TPA: hypothetical protein VFC00_12250 [Micromonosporaceae bacterium]|nr:hypothetical protein [Micromonosporaceae bacterium]